MVYIFCWTQNELGGMAEEEPETDKLTRYDIIARYLLKDVYVFVCLCKVIFLLVEIYILKKKALFFLTLS